MRGVPSNNSKPAGFERFWIGQQESDVEVSSAGHWADMLPSLGHESGCFFLICLVGGLNRNAQEVIEYLQEDLQRESVSYPSGNKARFLPIPHNERAIRESIPCALWFKAGKEF